MKKITVDFINGKDLKTESMSLLDFGILYSDLLRSAVKNWYSFNEEHLFLDEEKNKKLFRKDFYKNFNQFVDKNLVKKEGFDYILIRA